ncbi:unnamed protein product [Prunus armeniaca]|uniref:Uncharacterized protein n=1 Tax=Prunus armeniaca TaxID=36596 RepID=A0A6J5UF65_PRUAR|nr:unnamed protein product [Prunus armeniaca]CAB4304280.1 unnamed protein product [Prunus armeniaca]
MKRILWALSLLECKNDELFEGSHSCGCGYNKWRAANQHMQFHQILGRPWLFQNHGHSHRQDEVRTCCNFKREHDEKLNEIKENVVEMKASSGKQMQDGKKQASQPGESRESDVLNPPDI